MEKTYVRNGVVYHVLFTKNIIYICAEKAEKLANQQMCLDIIQPLGWKPVKKCKIYFEKAEIFSEALGFKIPLLCNAEKKLDSLF